MTAAALLADAGVGARVRPAPVNKWVVTISIAFGAIMAAIDTSIVNVALPQIRGSLGATIEEITWISTAYIIAMVLVMPLTGFLGSFFGQKQVYVLSLLLFVAGSALCGVARSLPALVAYRALQGFGAGALQPTQQAILRQTFPPKEQGMAMAMFAMVIMVGPAVGPTLGGYIVDHYSWQWIFYINLPVGVVGTLLTLRFVHEPEDVIIANRARAELQKKNLDVAGIVLMCVGVSTLQYVLEEGQREDWFDSPLISALSFVAAVSLCAFVIRELTAKAPVVNLRMFRDRTFASATIIGGVMYAMLVGSMFLLPVFMQEVLGFDATQSGLTLMPRTLAMMVLTPLIGKLYNRVPPALTVGLGAVLFVVGSYQLSHITLQSGSPDIILPLIVTGFGFACLFIPLTTAALTFVSRTELGDAAGLNSFIRQIGGSFGLTIFATLLSTFSKRATASVSWNVTDLRPDVVLRLEQLVRGLQAQGFGPVEAKQTALRALAGSVARQGSVLGFEKTFLVQGVAFVAVLPLLFFLRVGTAKKAEHIDLSME
ncbi:MAG TPA: DHA2 family efflux MFS transporter permease subunit [Polyangiaceae bacterium]|nr:DHA2 family efflux MFS transporter permease subunit [Polyangiaceae bacterium]